MSKLKAKIMVILLPMLALILANCGNKNEERVGGGQFQRLAAVDSLLGVRGDSVLELINLGLNESKDSMTWNEFYVRKAKYFGLSSTPDSQLFILDHVLKFAEPRTHCERGRQLLAYTYNCRGAYYHNFHRYADSTIIFFRKAYDLLMMSDDKSQAPDVAANLGDAYAFENNLPKAAMCYRRALFISDSLKLPEKRNITLYLGFASICQQLGDNDNALRYYRLTEKHFSEMAVGMQAYFLNNFGNYYYYLHQYDEALSKFLALKGLLEHNKMQNNFDMFLCEINLADVYLNLNRLDDAKKSLDQVEPFAKKHGDPAMIYYAHTIRIGIAAKEKQWGVVQRLMDEDTANGKVVPFQLRQIRNRYLNYYYLDTGNYKQAYEDMIADEEFTDSLEHNRTNMRTADIMAQMTADTLRLHTDLAMEQQQAHNRQISLVAIIAIVLAIALGLLIILLRVREHRRVSDAVMKIMDLRLANARNRFSPHFVFNVLNNFIISSNDKDNSTLLSLTKFIRNGLDMSRQMLISLTDEMEYVKNYINVEKPMVGNDFDFQFSIDDGIDKDNVYVPSMVIQLMVENALVHGLNGWDGHKMLRIEINKKPKTVEIKVIDNGPGFNVMAMRKKKGHGLDIIRQTLAVLNSRSKQKIIFNMNNVTAPDGKVMGCQTTIIVPDNLKKLNNINNFKPTI